MDTLKVFIVLLVIVAVALGALIIIENRSDLGSFVADITAIISSGSAGKKAERRGTNASLSPVPNLTPEQSQILTAPAPGEEQAHADLLNKNAKSAPYLAIGVNCMPNPLVIQISAGALLLVKNTDSQDHTVSFYAQHTLALPAGSSKELNADFMKAGGAYGYGCDQFSGAVGIIVVTK